MVAKSHIPTNIATTVLVSNIFVSTIHYGGEKLKLVGEITASSLVSMFSPTTSENTFLFLVMGFLLFLIGSVLPDIDNPNSVLGRFNPIPLGHRTITHAIWIPIILFLVGIKFHLINFLALGYLLHILRDAASSQGVCFLWPFTKYIDYGNGAKIKNNHRWYLYKTGSITETILVIILVCIASISTFYLIKIGAYQQYVDLPQIRISNLINFLR